MILLLCVLISFNSCQGTNKTVNHSTEDVQQEEILQVEDFEANEASTLNHNLWNELLQKHVSDEGNVNYKAFKNDPTDLVTYLELLSNNAPDNSWSKSEKLAYWINAYNAFTVKLIIDKYPVKSIKDIRGPWDIRFIELGGKSYTLNHIEHEILRKMNEPRIHFAIVCASVSCPKLQNQAFEPSTLETQLSYATKGFLADPERNNLTENRIKISRIFKWFAKDFKKEGSLIDFLNEYSEITISQDAKKSFKVYDWNLNE